jgi:hypothetical protein
LWHKSSRKRDSYPDDPDFVVLADPDGNRFCIVDLAHSCD